MTFKTKFKIGEVVKYRSVQRLILGVQIFCTAQQKVVEYLLEDKFEPTIPWSVSEGTLLEQNPR